MPHAPTLAALALALPAVLGAPGEPPPQPVGQVPAASLLSAAPSDAVAIVHVGDVRGLAARSAASAWLGLLAAPELPRALAAARDDDDRDPAAEERALDASTALLAALGSAEGAVAFAQFERRGAPVAPVALALVVRAGDALEAPLVALLRGAATPVREGATTLWAADAGVIEAYMRRGDLHIAVDASDAVTATRIAREALARLDAGAAPSGRLAQFTAAGGAAPDVEFAADLAPLWRALGAEVPAPLTSLWAAWSSLAWAHGSVRFGAGEHLDIALELPYAEGLAARLCGALGPCDPRAMALAPLVSAAVSVAHIDVRQCFELALAELAAQDRARHDTLRGLLAGTKDTLGFDVEGELLASFTGAVVSFTLPTDSGALAAGERGVPQLAALAPSCSAFEVRDPEPFFPAVELAATLLGGTAGSMTRHGAEVYTVASEPQLFVAIGERHVCVGTNADAVDSFLARAAAAEDAPAGFLTRESHSAALEGLGGAYVSLASTNMLLAGYGDVLRSGDTLLAGAFEVPPRVTRAAREVGALLESRGLAGFKGTVRTRLECRAGRVRWRLEAR